MNNKPGKLTRMDLREIWQNEEYDFSNWLAEEENLSQLSDEIGIQIRLPAKEVGVANTASIFSRKKKAHAERSLLTAPQSVYRN
jgi:hypothetical protein